MGKRKANLTGLSRFLPEMTSQTPESSSSKPIPPVNGTTIIADSPALQDSAPAAKKRKVEQTGLLGPGLEKYDATGLVPFYTSPAQVPEHLQKYFSQRERYFSRYAEGCLLDEEGWYSVTPERIADQIAERCRCDVVLDAFCGVGGNAIAFARTCERVIALDVSPVRLALARHNAALYGVAERIEFVLGDFLSFARALRARGGAPKRAIDVVFLSPPWGGPSYLTAPASPVKTTTVPDTPGAEMEEAHAQFGLESVRPVHGAELFKIARGISRNVAYFLPRNTRVEEVAALLEDEGAGAAGKKGKGKSKAGAAVEMVEVEEEWMGSKLKALTCYFGGLVGGQEDLFES